MSHTIYAAKFEKTIIHQHVDLRRKSQSHAPAHVLMRLYPIDKSLVCLQAKEGRHVRILNSYVHIKVIVRTIIQKFVNSSENCYVILVQVAFNIYM